MFLNVVFPNYIRFITLFQAVSNLPKITREVNVLSENTNSLFEKIRGIKRELEIVSTII